MGDEQEFVEEEAHFTDELNEANTHFLHGRLRVHVIKAENLPDTDTAFFNIDWKDKTDPYVTGDLGQARLFKTKYIPNDLNPTWDEIFNIYVCHHADKFVIRVKDKEHVGATFIASTEIPTETLLQGEVIEGRFDLKNGPEVHGQINLKIQYFDKSAETETGFELLDGYFPMTEGNRVTLYQDADTPQLPQFEGISNCDGTTYQATTCWKDLFNAIKGAKRFVYVTGWSVYTEINLVRGDDDPDGYSNVGRLLKSKAEEGVKVLLLVWDEMLSTENRDGLMGTHDEETRKYFAGTAVECVCVSRVKSEGALASNFVGTCYTHHQKTIIVDAPLDDETEDKFRIMAFIGGLDITDGRYDSPVFPLWSTIKNVHTGDFYQNCTVGATQETGPRQPWHDCHSRVEGPAARDIMRNFEERWRKQAEDRVRSLFHINDEEFEIASGGPGVENPSEGGKWNVQLFRSITNDSCIFDFDRHEYLFSKGGRLVENTIMRAMVQHIRRSERFMYFENQYFLGSAYSWYGDSNTLSNHIIPREITQKIVEKIADNQPFKVYIVIPMFPEGDPSSAAIQEILYLQYRTMESMYKRIARAINEFGLETHPTDYLNFFCLAKREGPDEMEEGEFEEPSGLAKKARQYRRHCVYVHSKMTIFDDQYVIVGSANVNQRSLGGNRDTEIAVGAYQPDQTIETAPEGYPAGGVHTYRMALWAAHLGECHPAFLKPETDECLAKVRENVMAFWETYVGEDPQHSDMHMLPYPLTVDIEGDVMPLVEPFDKFPDTNANVLGSKSGFLPAKLTT